MGPRTIILEFVEGCNEACQTCGIKAIRERPGPRGLKFMSSETLNHYIENLKGIGGWKQYAIVISGRGEPTLHPDFDAFIMEIAQELSDVPIYLETNGQSLEYGPHTCHRFKELGINLVAVNTKSSARDASFLAKRKIVFEAQTNKQLVTEEGLKPNKAISVHDFLVLENILGPYEFINAGGFAGPRSKISYPCHLPFISFMIRWDGNLALCNHDYIGEAKLNNKGLVDLYSFWNGSIMNGIRQSHLELDPQFNPCASCNGANKGNRMDLVNSWKPTGSKYDAAVVNEWGAWNEKEAIHRDFKKLSVEFEETMKGYNL